LQVRKAVITAAGKAQRALPLQTLIDRDGSEKSVLALLIEQALSVGVEEVGVVVWPGDAVRYTVALAGHAAVRFIEQPEPRGYADAICCARSFTEGEPFLHMVADHLCPGSEGTLRRLMQLAESEECIVSAVQSTRESLLPRFGAVGGARIAGHPGLYLVDTVLEKPTPTEAEQKLHVPGLRIGHYLCFFGMHVLTSTVMELLGRSLAVSPNGSVTLSAVLGEIAQREKYLAMEADGRRFDLGSRYGLLHAQLALALNGKDRDVVLSQLIELLAERESARTAQGSAR
jgi:UTP--glucose-1-phosphate uridylyltransferase